MHRAPLRHLRRPRAGRHDTVVSTRLRRLLLLCTGLAAATMLVLAGSIASSADADPPLVFAVIGDFGLAGPNEQAVATLVKSWSPAFIITVGDNNYGSGEASTIDQNIGQYYHEWIAPYTGAYGPGADTNRFFPSLGNHDWVATDARPYRGYFTLPGNERYYDLAWGPVHLLSVDSDPKEPDGTISSSAQATWLQERLATATACWKLVYFHHAPYSSGPHGSDPRMQWPFKTWGASAVLAGHDHTYERLSVDGLTYFVNGLGGNSQYVFGPPVPGSLVRYRDGFGAMRVTASRTAIIYEFIGVNGTLIDTYTETGDCQAPLAATPTPYGALPPPTPTSTPTATPVPPTACAPRPPVRQQLTRLRAGQLQATVWVTTSALKPTNSLRGLRLTRTANAVVDMGDLVSVTAPVDLPLAPGATQATFTLRRLVDTAATTVALTVTDECGAWPTLLGGGPSSF